MEHRTYCFKFSLFHIQQLTEQHSFVQVTTHLVPDTC